MAYLGTKPQSGFISQEANQYFTGLTQNYIDLNQSISSLSSVIVLVNGVVQENSDLTLTSSTRITLGATLVSGDKVTCIYVAKISSTQAPAVGTVTNDMLSGSIANSKLANSSITLNGSAVSLGGSATVDNTPYFDVAKTSDQNVTAATWTKCTFDSERIDSDGAFDLANDKFVVPSGQAGKYFFSAIVTTGSSTAYNYYDGYAGIGLNGTRIRDSLGFTANASSPYPNYSQAVCTIILDLAVSDYVEVFGYSQISSGTAQLRGSAAGQTCFTGFKLI